ncbi:glycosyltransferase [Candidatus Omnitrophota bacterium]
MRGDKLLIRKHHTMGAERVIKRILPEILSSPDKYVITVSGESGSGKTEVSHEIAKCLSQNGIKSITLHQDDYFKLPPKTNYAARRKKLSIVGMGEVRISLLNKHIKLFKTNETSSFKKPLVDFNKDIIKEETLRCKSAKVMIIDGTYAGGLKHVDKKIFLSRNWRDTLSARRERKRDQLDDYDEKILAIEHRIISQHKKDANIVLKKNYKIDRVRTPKKEVRSIAMLSVHGYVDPKPTLGKTDTGGQVTYVLELSKALAKKGIKVDIYTRQFQHKKAIEQVAKNVRIIRIPCGGKAFIPKEEIFPYLDTYVNKMERFIKKHRLRYDIYHSHYWDAGYVAMKLTERFKYFFVHTFHSLGAWKKENMGGNARNMEKMFSFKLRIKWEKIIYKKLKALVMTSTDMIGRSRRFYNYHKKNYVVLPAGVNTAFFRPLRYKERDRRIDVPQNYVFWVGRFDTNKGLDYLLKAFASIIHKNKDLFLVIGGGSQSPKQREKDLRTYLKGIVQKESLENRVFFTGHIKDELMPPYYRRAKFFVLPSKFEPFGMTAAEAMACGTALIASNRSGIRKYLKNKKNCLVVNPSNKTDLGWAMQVLNRNSSFRNKIAKAGRIFAKEHFSWLKIADKSIDVYDDLLEKI